MTDTTRQRLLEMAAQRIGKEALARQLSTPVHLIDAWMRGLSTMPDRKLMELAAIIDDLGDGPTSS